MWLGCEWRHARKRWAGNFWWFLKKAFSWDLILGEASPAGGYGIRVCWDGVEIWQWAGQSSWGLTEGRCSNSHHIKIESLSPRVEKLKVKKWINVSYLNYGESSLSGDFSASEYFTIRILDMLQIDSKTNCAFIYQGLVWFVGFYGISTFVGYLTPNPFLCK